MLVPRRFPRIARMDTAKIVLICATDTDFCDFSDLCNIVESITCFVCNTVIGSIPTRASKLPASGRQDGAGPVVAIIFVVLFAGSLSLRGVRGGPEMTVGR